MLREVSQYSVHENIQVFFVLLNNVTTGTEVFILLLKSQVNKDTYVLNLNPHSILIQKNISVTLVRACAHFG